MQAKSPRLASRSAQARRRDRAPNQIRSASSAIAVELAMDDAELAERVRMMLIEWPDIEVVDAEHGRIPQVRITDRAVEVTRNVPVLVLTDASGVTEALQAGASAVLSECADGDTLSTAIRAAARPSYAVGGISRSSRRCLRLWQCSGKRRRG